MKIGCLSAKVLLLYLPASPGTLCSIVFINIFVAYFPSPSSCHINKQCSCSPSEMCIDKTFSLKLTWKCKSTNQIKQAVHLMVSKRPPVATVQMKMSESNTNLSNQALATIRELWHSKCRLHGVFARENKTSILWLYAQLQIHIKKTN